MSRSSKISFASCWAAVQRSCTERRSPASMGSRKLDVRPRYTHPCLACRRRSKCKRNFSTFANRSLGLDAADDALARFFGGNERATLAQRVRSKPDLLPQLVHLTGNGDVLARVPLGAVSVAVLPFLLAYFAVVALVSFAPRVALLLPELMGQAAR